MNNMIDRIIEVLSQNDIQNFLINENIIETQELFYIKHSLNLTRNKNVSKYEITLYRDFIYNDTNMRGSASCLLNSSMSDMELNENILSAYEAALSVRNPYYKLPHGEAMFVETDNISSLEKHSADNAVDTASSLGLSSNKSTNETDNLSANKSINETDNLSANKSINETDNLSATDIVNALFVNDTISKTTNAFINSTEIFITTSTCRIINSNGVNASYTTTTYSGEFVVQCTSPADVELYNDFKYSSKDYNILDSLSAKVANALIMVKDRSIAKAFSEDMKYDTVILEGQCVGELFDYYLKRLDASMIYPKYSSFDIGKSVVPECELSNASATDKSINSDQVRCIDSDSYRTLPDKLNITLTPKLPYSCEGIALKKLELIKDNIAQYITGNARFAFYLGINPTGECNSYKLECGNTSIEDLKAGKYLRVVNFSDFQMDSLSGQIGGEYRLAYYYDGTKEIPVTNGSISANINDIVKSVKLSSESQSSYNFDGPLAISYSV
ncbi:MAG: metallopeptidase TldD-related protein [Clostridiales bacterium]|nr:metallopeptidase TldD-related protein [Clostridiales bacterium]